jgi:hypothetical protein
VCINYIKINTINSYSTQRLSTSCGLWKRLPVKRPIEIRVECLLNWAYQPITHESLRKAIVEGRVGYSWDLLPLFRSKRCPHLLLLDKMSSLTCSIILTTGWILLAYIWESSPVSDDCHFHSHTKISVVSVAPFPIWLHIYPLNRNCRTSLILLTEINPIYRDMLQPLG